MIELVNGGPILVAPYMSDGLSAFTVSEAAQAEIWQAGRVGAPSGLPRRTTTRRDQVDHIKSVDVLVAYSDRPGGDSRAG